MSIFGEANQDESTAKGALLQYGQDAVSKTLDALRSMAQRIDDVMPGTVQEAAQNAGDMVAGITTRTKRAVPNFAAKVAALFKKG